MIPGPNVLGLALGVIAPQGLQWARNTGRTTNAAGHQVPSYGAATRIQGSAQPVPQRMYASLGLDWNKSYINVYTRAGVVTVDRDGAGDKIIFGGHTYLCESATDWSGQDGWQQITAVKVPA